MSRRLSPHLLALAIVIISDCVPSTTLASCQSATNVSLPDVVAGSYDLQATGVPDPVPGSSCTLPYPVFHEWYRFTVDEPGRVRITTCSTKGGSPGLNLVFFIRVFQGSCGTLQCIAQSEGECCVPGEEGCGTTVEFCPELGGEYFVVVSGGGPSEIIYNWDCPEDCERCGLEKDECEPCLNADGELICDRLPEPCRWHCSAGSARWRCDDPCETCGEDPGECIACPDGCNPRPADCGQAECFNHGTSWFCQACEVCHSNIVNRCRPCDTPQCRTGSCHDACWTLIPRDGAYEVNFEYFEAEAPNTTCETAEEILPGEDVYSLTTECAGETPDLDDCHSSIESIGPDVWYTILGPPSADVLHLEVTGREFDDEWIDHPFVRVFRSDNCVEFECITSAVGLYSEPAVASWCPEPGARYYIAVSAAFEQSTDEGLFTLNLSSEPPPDSDDTSSCDSAVPIDLSSTMANQSTECGELIEAIPACVDCGFTSNVGAAWYSAIGTGGLLMAQVTTADFEPNIHVLRTDDCSTFSCVAMAPYGSMEDHDSSLPWTTWCSEQDVEYKILVSGSTEKGRFSLHLSDRGPCPVNVDCASAETLSVPGSVNARFFSGGEPAPYCTYGSDPVPSLWYRVTGNGARFTASICSSSGGAHATPGGLVLVYEACGGDCVTEDPDDFVACGDTGNELSWDTEDGVDYFVQVRGNGCRPDTFRVSIQSDEESLRDKLNDEKPCFNFNNGCPDICIGVAQACHDNVVEPPSGADTQLPSNTTSGNAMVLLHSGQEARDEADLIVPGLDRATDLVIRRRHLTRVLNPGSPFGEAWAFNFDHVLEERPDGTLEARGFARTDTFLPASGGWRDRSGRLNWVHEATPELLVMRLMGGTEMEFETELDPATGLRRSRLVAVVSATGHRIEVVLNRADPSQSILERRIDGMVDAFGRQLTFLHDGDRIDRIVDWTGREVVYGYDGDGRLTTVRSPTVNSTSNLDGGSLDNNFPSGQITRYAYVDAPGTELHHALSSIEYPREVASGMPPRLSWTYEMSSADPFYGFVKTHAVGNLNAGSQSAGGVFHYLYEEIEDAETGPNDAVIRTRVTNRVGTVATYDLNVNGQVLQERIESGGMRPGGPQSFVRTFQYTDDGDLLQETQENGSVHVHLHVPETHPRTAHANTAERRLSFQNSSGTTQEIKTEIVHEPIFNRPYQVIDPRGFESGNSPEDFTTTYTYDYMENLPEAIAVYSVRLGVTEAELADVFAELGIVDLGGDVNGDGNEEQRCGNLIRIEYPDVTQPVLQSADEVFRYNEHGQLAYHQDAEGNVTEREYYPAQDPSGLGGSSPGTEGGGFLGAIIQDTSAASGRNSGHHSPPVSRRLEFEYRSQPYGAPGSVGDFPANDRGVPTAIVDGRGTKTLFLVNELDQVIKTILAADVTSGTPFSYEQITRRDANGALLDQRVQNVDTLDPAHPWVVTTYERDILDQLLRVTLDAEGPDALAIINEQKYDRNGNLLSSSRHVVNGVAAVTDQWDWDERDLLVAATRGFDSAEESSITTEVNAAGLATAVLDASQDRTERIYDDADRLVLIIDREGNETHFTLDDSGNVTIITRKGRIDDNQQGPFVVLAEETRRYDERNRLWRIDRLIAHHPARQVGAIDPGANASGPNQVTTTLHRDRLGRVIRIVDADQDTYETRYDGLSRPILSIDPMGNETHRTFDPNGNLTVVQEHERRPSGTMETYETIREYDALDRLIALTEPNGQVTRFAYDSRGNIISTEDALGNVVEHRHDRLSRLTNQRLYLSDDGTAAGPGNHVGVINRWTSWDALHRLASRKDGNGNTTFYMHDALDRLTRTEYEDGTFETWSYNADSELQEHVNQRGEVAIWTHDKKGRPLSVAIQNASAGTASKVWAYDGLDRVIAATDDNGGAPGATVTSTYWYDTLSRTIQETQSIEGRADLAVVTEWAGAGRRVSTTYPDGRRVSRQHDGLDRTTRIEESPSGALIAQYAHVGSGRVARIDYGNGTYLDKVDGQPGYDENRRHAWHEWQHPAFGIVASYFNEYDGPGGVGTNRRIREVRGHGPFAGNSDTYEFDSAYRMTSFKPSHAPQSTRTFDGADKMLEYFREGLDQQPAVDQEPGQEGVNQYSSFAGMDRGYDDNGALATDGERTYSHDFWDRIVRVDDSSGGLMAEYSYASDNRRVLKRLSTGEEMRYVLDGWQVVEERDGDGFPLTQHVDGLGLDDHVQVLDLTTGKASYYHGNSQGSVGALTDDTGQVTAWVEYGWFGAPTVTDGAGLPLSPGELPGADAYLFQGRRYDLETGLYYYRNRYYDAAVGEFVTIDPLGNWQHGQGNGYDAFGGDPWNRADPMGLDETQWDYNHQAFVAESNAMLQSDFMRHQQSISIATGNFTEPLPTTYGPERPSFGDYLERPFSWIGRKAGGYAWFFGRGVGNAGDNDAIGQMDPSECPEVADEILRHRDLSSRTAEEMAESAELAAETSARAAAEIAPVGRLRGVDRAGDAARGRTPRLPGRDATGKVHGDLPKPQDLKRVPTEDLQSFQDDLRQSVRERIRRTEELGPDRAHGQRQAAEQDLIQHIQKILDDR